MTDYAIGDIQGCYERLRDVLAKVDFRPPGTGSGWRAT